MWRRFCCQSLKERYIPGTVLFGIRSMESNKRKARYKEPTACRVYTKKKVQQQVYPIVNWTEEDERFFIEDNNIRLHNRYYDEHGCLDLSKRVGCIACPLQGDRGKADFKEYPRFLRLWAQAYNQYVSEHKAVEGVYHDLVWHLFYSNHGDEKYKQTYHGLFEPPDPKQFLEDYFQIDL